MFENNWNDTILFFCVAWPPADKIMKGTFGVYVNLEEKDRNVMNFVKPPASLGDPLAELMLHVGEVVKVV